MEPRASPHENRQPQTSSFLYKTPLEIRQQIYTEIIKSWNLPSKLHIFFPSSLPRQWSAFGFQPRHEKLTYFPCDNPQPIEGDGHVDISATIHCALAMSDQGLRPTTPAGTFWALLLTCRQIHSETVSLLYSSFTFDLVDIYSAYRFLHRVPIAQLNHISSLRLSGITVPHGYLGAPGFSDASKGKDNNKWLAICARLGHMRGLQNLKCVFFNNTPSAVLEDDLLGAICRYNIQVPGYFVVSLPQRNTSSAAVQVPAMQFLIEGREGEDASARGDGGVEMRPPRPLVRENMIDKVRRRAWMVLSSPSAALSRLVDRLDLRGSHPGSYDDDYPRP